MKKKEKKRKHVRVRTRVCSNTHHRRMETSCRSFWFVCAITLFRCFLLAFDLLGANPCAVEDCPCCFYASRFIVTTTRSPRRTITLRVGYITRRAAPRNLAEGLGRFKRSIGLFFNSDGRRRSLDSRETKKEKEKK